MVKSRETERSYTLAEIEARLKGNGLSEETVRTVVTTLEPKPITIEEAAKRYDVPPGTLYWWLHRGHLHEVGRLTFPAPGGGKVLIDEGELQALLRNPPKPGRPPKELPAK